VDESSNLCGAGQVCSRGNCVSDCQISNWSPEPSDVCSGQNYTQTSNCQTTKNATGTKTCAENQVCQGNPGQAECVSTSCLVNYKLVNGNCQPCVSSTNANSNDLGSTECCQGSGYWLGNDICASQSAVCSNNGGQWSSAICLADCRIDADGNELPNNASWQSKINSANWLNGSFGEYNLNYSNLNSYLNSPYKFNRQIGVCDWQCDKNYTLNDTESGCVPITQGVCPISEGSASVDNSGAITWSWKVDATENCVAPATYNWAMDSRSGVFTTTNLDCTTESCSATLSLDTANICETNESKTIEIQPCGEIAGDSTCASGLSISAEPSSCPCGNGVIDAGEQCDAGAEANGNGQSGCNTACQFEALELQICADQLPLNTIPQKTTATTTCNSWADSACASWSQDPDSTIDWVYSPQGEFDCSYTCANGYQYQNNRCEPANICGDNHKAETEQCDLGEDGNSDTCATESCSGCSTSCRRTARQVKCADYPGAYLPQNAEYSFAEFTQYCADPHAEGCQSWENVDLTTNCLWDCVQGFERFGNQCCPSGYTVDDSGACINPELPPEEQEQNNIISNLGANLIEPFADGDIAFWENRPELVPSVSRAGSDLEEMIMRFKISSPGYPPQDGGKTLIRWKLSGKIVQNGEVKERVLYSKDCIIDEDNTLSSSGSSICERDLVNCTFSDSTRDCQSVDGDYIISLINPIGVNNEGEEESMQNFLINQKGADNSTELYYPRLEFFFSRPPVWGGKKVDKIYHQVAFRFRENLSDLENVSLPDESIKISSDGFADGVKETVNLEVQPGKIAPLFDYTLFQE
jgi:hypothetical protein